MAIPKLLKTMRESLSGVENNIDKSLEINNSDDPGTRTTITNSDINLRGYVGDGNYGNISLTNASAGANEITMKIHSDFSVNADGNVILTGIAEPIGDTDAANKAYVDNNGGTFTATYGTTTYAEIVAAFNQGKTIYCYNSSYTDTIYILTTRPTGSNVLYFYDLKQASANNGYATTYAKYCMINSSGSWSVGSSSSKAAAGAIYYNGQTNLISTTGYYRPIRVSTSAPTSSDGYVGDIWIQYGS